MNPDFSIENHGSVVLLRPLTSAANSWIEENLPEDRQTFGNAVAVEHRYIADILNGIIDAGLTMRGWAGAPLTVVLRGKCTYPARIDPAFNKETLARTARRIAQHHAPAQGDFTDGQRWINGERVEDFRVTLDEPSYQTPLSGRPLCERCGYMTTHKQWPLCKPCQSGTRLLLTSTDKKMLRAMGISGR